MVSLKASLRSGLLPGLLITGLIMGGRWLGTFERWELLILDRFMQGPLSEPTDERIVLVGIDESTLQRVKTYPIPDQDLADLLERLYQHQPRVIGLDILRDVPVEPGFAALQTAFQTMESLIGPEKALPPVVSPPPDLPSERVGIIDAWLDTDGQQRNILLGTQIHGDSLPTFKFSWSLRIAEAYLKHEGVTLENGLKDPSAMRFGPVEIPRFRSNFGGYSRGNASEGSVQTLLHFRRGDPSFHYLTAEAIYAGNYDPEQLRDRIVLVGVTTASIQDFVSAATSSVVDPDTTWIYGLEVQAHAVSQIISAVLDGRPLIQTWPDWLEYLWIFGWSGFSLLMTAYARSPWQTLLGTGGCVVGLVVGSYLLWLGGWWIPLVPAAVALILNSLSLSTFYEYDRRLATVVAAKQERIQLLQQSNQILEQRVAERTEALSEALTDLQTTQDKLVESAKMAALGQLVAGVAHEVNTPVGCAVTAASMLSDMTEQFAEMSKDGKLKRTILTRYLDTAKETSEIILENLKRASDLIESFKQVAVDRSHWELRHFNLKTHLELVISSLESQVPPTIQIKISGDPNLEIESYPAAYSQIMTHLVLNSVGHAFESQEQGWIESHFHGDQQQIQWTYRDNGCGIPPEHLPKIFEPFFTTARYQGGIGLGLHIVYNLVTQNLHGTIQCESQVGVGTTFLITLPLAI